MYIESVISKCSSCLSLSLYEMGDKVSLICAKISPVTLGQNSRFVLPSWEAQRGNFLPKKNSDFWMIPSLYVELKVQVDSVPLQLH